jgi:hypothetical protein
MGYCLSLAGWLKMGVRLNMELVRLALRPWGMGSYRAVPEKMRLFDIGYLLN